MIEISPLSQGAPRVGSKAQTSLPTRPATSQQRLTDTFVGSDNASRCTAAQPSQIRPPQPPASAAPATWVEVEPFHLSFGKTDVERQASTLRNRWVSIATLFMELEEAVPSLVLMTPEAQRPPLQLLADYLATKPNYIPHDTTPFLAADPVALTVLQVHAEQAARVMWAHIDGLQPALRSRLLCMISNFTGTCIGGPVCAEAPKLTEEERVVTLPTLHSPFEYYLGLALSRHPNPGTRMRAQQFLQAHDALCEHMERQKTGREQAITSWWHDGTSLVALRPSEFDYAPLANWLPGDAPSYDAREVLEDMGFAGIRTSQLRATLTRVCLQSATRRGLTLDPWEGSKANSHVVGLDPASFRYQPERFDAGLGLVDPATHALPDTLSTQARALAREHAGTLTTQHALIVRLNALADEADRLDCESKADGAIWQQVVYLMQHDISIGALCNTLHDCKQQLHKLADERAFATRQAQADKACAELLAELDAEAVARSVNTKRKKKKPKSKSVDTSPDATVKAQRPNVVPVPQPVEPTPAASLAINDAYIEEPSTRTVTAPSCQGYQRVPHAVRRMVDLGAGVTLPTRLSKEALKDLLERNMDPGTFVRSHEPLWRSAARSLAYHMRKHAAHSTAEDYIAAARVLYDRAYMNEVCRRADDPTQWIQQIRTEDWYAAYGWDGRLISLCNSRFCGQTHFPEARGVEAAWPSS